MGNKYDRLAALKRIKKTVEHYFTQSPHELLTTDLDLLEEIINQEESMHHLLNPEPRRVHLPLTREEIMDLINCVDNQVGELKNNAMTNRPKIKELKELASRLHDAYRQVTV